MDSRDFIRMLKHEAVDGAIQSTLRSLRSPRVPQPVPDPGNSVQKSIADRFNAGAEREQAQSTWFRSLSAEHQAMLISLLEECVESCALSVCTLIDGVGGPWEGVFELTAVDANDHRTVLNPENSDMLHDLLSEVIEEERKS